MEGLVFKQFVFASQKLPTVVGFGGFCNFLRFDLLQNGDRFLRGKVLPCITVNGAHLHDVVRAWTHVGRVSQHTEPQMARALHLSDYSVCQYLLRLYPFAHVQAQVLIRQSSSH